MRYDFEVHRVEWKLHRKHIGVQIPRNSSAFCSSQYKRKREERDRRER